MNKLYRIYTEDTNINLSPVVMKYFDGFSRFAGQGWWMGEREFSQVYEILTEDNEEEHQLIQRLVEEIKFVNKQETVLLVEMDVRGRLI
jgi:hypothetical protein